MLLHAYVSHWKVIKHFIYAQYGCENQSKMVNSLGCTSTGSVSSGDRSVTSSVTSTQKCELWRHCWAKNFQGVIEAVPHLLRYVVLSSVCLGRWGSGLLSERGQRSGEYKHKWQSNLFDHLDTVYCDSETIKLLHRKKCMFFWRQNYLK